MRGELRTTNSFGGGGRDGHRDGGDSFRHERGPSFSHSIVRSFVLSVRQVEVSINRESCEITALVEMSNIHPRNCRLATIHLIFR